MSKSYNMAGWRVGFCLGNAKMIAAWRDQELSRLRRVPADSDRLIIALRECEEETQKIREVYQKRRDVLIGAVPRRLAGRN